jgi:PBP1b-binding outer membrane lipoprotein LpoB
MKTTLSLLPLLCSATLLFSGCSSNQEATVQDSAVQQETVAQPPAEDKAKPVNQEHIIRQAEVKFEVKDLAQSTPRVERMVEEMGATLANTTQHQTETEKTTDFVIRVQPDKFKPLLRNLQKESVHLEVRTISSEDVGMEYVDLQARKKAKLAVEQRFLGLLKEAKNIQEILEVERQIQAVREQIESAEARLRYLQNQTAYSTIRLSMYQHLPLTAPEGPSFVTRLVEALNTGWQLWLTLIIGVFYLWPMWLVGLGIMVYLRKRNVA